MTPETKRLIRLFGQLPEEAKKTLLAFAEFLASREEASARDEPPQMPVSIPRPEKETVVGAIRRLSRVYPMLDKAAMLDETSSLMGEHILHGQPAPATIDKLEAAFEHRYREFSRSADDERQEGRGEG